MEDKVTRIYIYEWRERCDVDEIFFKVLLPVSGLTVFSWVHRLGSRLVSRNSEEIFCGLTRHVVQQSKHSLKKQTTNLRSPKAFYYPVKTMSLQLCR